MNESCHVRHKNESCHTHIITSCHPLSKKSYHAHINHSYHTYENVTSHIRMSHATHANRYVTRNTWALRSPTDRREGIEARAWLRPYATPSCHCLLRVHTPRYTWCMCVCVQAVRGCATCGLNVCMCAQSSCVCMTLSTEKATSPKQTRSKDSNFSVQIQIKPKSQLESVPWHTEESKFLDLVDLGGVAISVETVITNAAPSCHCLLRVHTARYIYCVVCV